MLYWSPQLWVCVCVCLSQDQLTSRLHLHFTAQAEGLLVSKCVCAYHIKKCAFICVRFDPVACHEFPLDQILINVVFLDVCQGGSLPTLAYSCALVQM